MAVADKNLSLKTGTSHTEEEEHHIRLCGLSQARPGTHTSMQACTQRPMPSTPPPRRARVAVHLREIGCGSPAPAVNNVLVRRDPFCSNFLRLLALAHLQVYGQGRGAMRGLRARVGAAARTPVVARARRARSGDELLLRGAAPLAAGPGQGARARGVAADRLRNSHEPSEPSAF